MNFEHLSREELVERLRVLERAPSSTSRVAARSEPAGPLAEGRLLARSPDVEFEARRDRDRLQLLSDTGRALTSTLDARETLTRVARLLVPRLADWVVFHCLEREQLLLGCVAHADEVAEQLLAEQLAQPVESGALVSRVAQRGNAVLVGRATTAREVFGVALTLEGVEADGLRGCVVVPVTAGARVLGALTLCSTRVERAFDASDLSLAAELASRTGLAVDHARLYQEAQEAVRARENLMAIVSHDLRNPLNTIALNLSLLTRPWDGQESADRRRGRSQLESIRRSVERVSRMVDDLLAASTMQAGHFTVRTRPEPAAALLEDLVQALEPLAAQQGVRLDAAFPEGLPPVRCDRDRVLQVFVNLCTNALHVLPDGGVISVSAQREESVVVFTVADTGPGIPPGQLTSVFERYWQAEPGASSGVGLGLSIVKGIVEAHGGRAWAESPAGGGARFSFSLPLAP